jgi:hypothetical protein
VTRLPHIESRNSDRANILWVHHPRVDGDPVIVLRVDTPIVRHASANLAVIVFVCFALIGVRLECARLAENLDGIARVIRPLSAQPSANRAITLGESPRLSPDFEADRAAMTRSVKHRALARGIQRILASRSVMVESSGRQRRLSGGVLVEKLGQGVTRRPQQVRFCRGRRTRGTDHQRHPRNLRRSATSLKKSTTRQNDASVIHDDFHRGRVPLANPSVKDPFLSPGETGHPPRRRGPRSPDRRASAGVSSPREILARKRARM